MWQLKLCSVRSFCAWVWMAYCSHPLKCIDLQERKAAGRHIICKCWKNILFKFLESGRIISSTSTIYQTPTWILHDIVRFRHFWQGGTYNPPLCLLNLFYTALVSFTTNKTKWKARKTVQGQELLTGAWPFGKNPSNYLSRWVGNWQHNVIIS